MNIFHTIAAKAPGYRGDVDHAITETRAGQAPLAQRALSPAGDASTKAEEMLRFMSERRNRPKKT
jgi:hypothetical protein